MEDCFELSISGSAGKAILVSMFDINKNILVSQVTIDMYGDYFRYQQYCNGHKIARIVRVETTPSYVGLGFGSEVLKKALEYLDNLILFIIPNISIIIIISKKIILIIKI